MHVQNKKYTRITDKWGFRHTRYVATATQNLKDFRNSGLWTCSHLMGIATQNLKDFRNSGLWTCSHLMGILRSQNNV